MRNHPPQSAIRRYMDKQEIKPSTLALRMGVKIGTVVDLLHGAAPVTDNLAQRLSLVLGGTKEFWKNTGEEKG